MDKKPQALWISEEYVGEDEDGKRWGSDTPDPYESCYTTAELGRAFRACQREHGYYTGAVYQDKKDGSTVRVGWVFRKRVKYQDCNRWYMQETWVTLHLGPPVKSIRYSLLERAA